MNISDAVDHLHEHGYFIQKGTLYNLVAAGVVPYRKVGKRLVFSRNRLNEWMQGKAEGRNLAGPALILARSARRKR